MTLNPNIIPFPTDQQDDFETFKKRTAQLRASGLNGEDIANRLGIRQEFVAAWLASSTLPSVCPVPIPERTLGAKETAKLLRMTLKETFPGVRFSVRIARHSLCESVNVSWTDGPTSKEVNTVLDVYRDQDGSRMDDSPIWRCNVLDDEPVRFGCFVHGSRHHSDLFVLSVKANLESLTEQELEAFMAQLSDHQREYPHTVVSICEPRASTELARVTRLDYLEG